MIVSGPLMGGDYWNWQTSQRETATFLRSLSSQDFPILGIIHRRWLRFPTCCWLLVAAALVTDSRQIHKWGTYPICRSQICPERKEISWSLKFSSSLFNLILTCAVYPLITLLIRISPFPLAP
ncbi:hypothetical protein BDQ94DRAFT_135090 [Aspergillus welwitschiae]|uniref:Uncharacterized protein n=1 Tax=Aspergillus welwitschiae TaxID=1341132 RepID=A0A3F3QFV2_9EURO|nr:hypothetical protein BDQ94DRAFT_135090 [Aspergillus welwitschiae]RDH37819.1 hypothetical protein BDQ94DRAFT_135090 [Aspergillus welwitschiae]